MDFIFSDEFKNQARFYNLKFRCIDCVHFSDTETKCSFEYPIEKHHYFYVMDFGSNCEPRFSFCKYFEML